MNKTELFEVLSNVHLPVNEVPKMYSDVGCNYEMSYKTPSGKTVSVLTNHVANVLSLPLALLESVYYQGVFDGENTNMTTNETISDRPSYK